KEREIPPAHRDRIRRDQEITLEGWGQLGTEGLRGRPIEVWIEEEKETFFKSLKQLLKIKTFVGTSEKAVLTQIWTALIAMLLLRWLKLKARYGWSLSNLLA